MEVLTMVRNIVLCSDGTGSKGMQKRGTNVFKLYEAVDLHGHGVGPNSPKQIAFYDDGVGTESIKLLKILGGAFGLGLSRNVKQLYADLVRTYEKGDQIYLFGFSRGAFTVRTLAGLINTCGIIKREVEHDEKLLDKVEMAYREYRSKYKPIYLRRPKKEISKKRADDFRKKYCVDDEQYAPEEKVHIKFIGVWDTVDAVGTPIMWLADFINLFIYRFKFADSKLSSEKKVKKACHALSIDDERLTFHPVMWDEKGENDDRIEQVWFAGVHSNVGGGYPKHGMSLVSLHWMMSKAEQAGLRFIGQDRELYRHRRNVTDKLYDPRSGAGVYFRYKPRDIGEFCQEFGITPKIHNSVIERIVQGTKGYAPGNIPFKCEFVSTKENYENYENYDQFIQKFRKHLNGETSLLDRVKWWVSLRRFSHYAFLGFSLIAVYFSLAAEISQSGFFGTLGKLFSGTGLILLAKHLLAKPFILIVIFVFYVILWLIRRKMNGIFSEFWYKI
jgi:uncharacterized protein (DUF2235 family)